MLSSITRLAMVAIITLSLDTEAHHGYWLPFISCGFEETKQGEIISNIIAPSYGRVFVRLDHIEYVREYIRQDGIECSSIHLTSGSWILVVGSVNNIRKRVARKILQNNKENN